jgi:acyl dehydratase
VTGVGTIRAKDIAVGSRSPERTLDPVTRTGIVRYAGAGGDFNLVHHDEPFAQSKGHPSVFAMGLYPAGVLAATVADWLGLRGLRSLTVRFVAQVWPGEIVRMSATVTAKIPQVDGVLVEFAAVGATPDGEVKLTGSGTVLLDE